MYHTLHRCYLPEYMHFNSFIRPPKSDLEVIHGYSSQVGVEDDRRLLSVSLPAHATIDRVSTSPRLRRVSSNHPCIRSHNPFTWFSR
ncbi:hypothetical protein J6590_063443 [Homalodisca vitripennis]|nr:hypothetical protein J6590_063443 [Homalodisca vitripennis]